MGHKVQAKKEGASHTKHHPSSNIQISNRVKIFQGFNPEWIRGNNTDAILHKQHLKFYILKDDIVYDIVYDIGYDIMQMQHDSFETSHRLISRLFTDGPGRRL